MINYEEQILSLMTHYYLSEKKAKEWYTKPHRILSDRNYSPKEMVDAGNGEEVLKWLKMILEK